jgi:hypothetical protein
MLVDVAENLIFKLPSTPDLGTKRLPLTFV